MRRSAAPSQLHAAKRAKFIVPHKALHSPAREPAQLQVTTQLSNVEPKNAATAVKPATDIRPTTEITPATEITSLMSPNTAQRVHQTFSPPSFLCRKPGTAAASKDHAVHQKTFIPPTFVCSKSACSAANKEMSYLDDKGLGDSELEHIVCDNDTDSKRISPLTDSAEDAGQKLALDSPTTGAKNDRTDDGARSPLKPCNITKKFHSPLASRPQCGSEHNQSQVGNRSSSTAGGHFKSPSVQSAKPVNADSDCAVKCGYFSVVWCKLSKKKHKKWEGDAVLVTQGQQVTLFDMDGKDIGKGSGYKSSELESLAEDETLVVGGKEIQVMSKLSEEQFKSGKCFSGAGSVQDDGSLPPNRFTSGHFKAFTNPVLAQKGETSKVSESRVQNVTPRFDPSAPDALVMTPPTSAHQWQHNKQRTPVVDVVVDPHLTYHLRPHQRDGVIFLYECVTGMKNYGGTGAILADDMGLGKTLQCICLVWTLLKQGMYGGKPPVKKVLIITPGSLVKNWLAEFRKWLGRERLQVFVVTGDSRVEDYVKTAVYPVLIISYEMFVRGYEVVKKVPFDLVVCDEGHRLKNTAIKTTSLINSLDTRRRIVLSGTPIQNDLQEFFAVVDFCNPGVLGSSAAFRRVYDEPILASRQPGATKDVVELGEERAAELSRLTRMFVLRRTQEINNKYLPPKVELVLFCRPSPLQVNMYHEILRSAVVRSCLMGRGYGAGLGAGSPHLLAIAALKQVCNHPRLIAPKVLKAAQSMTECGDADKISDGDSLFSGLVDKYQEQTTSQAVNREHSGKLATLAVILANVFASCPQDKVVLVSNHTKTLDLLQQFCTDCGYKYVRLDGHTPTAQRQQIVTRFNGSYGQENVFLLSSKAGGVGLNLVGASRLVLYDIDWNPANDLQAMARVWRDGQRKEVYIYRLLTTGSLEEKMYQRQISKQGLSGAVMDLKASDIQFSQEDLKDLFSFNEGTECDTHALLGCPCDGGGGEREGQSPLAPTLVKSCQLETKASTGQTRNLSMAELLEWEHLRGSSPHIHKGWCLDETKDYLSFLFWHKSNTGNL